MAASLLRYANREKVAQALTAQGYSVTRMTVNRWARGDEMPEIAARMITALFDHPDAKEAPLPWLGGRGRYLWLQVSGHATPPSGG